MTKGRKKVKVKSRKEAGRMRMVERVKKRINAQRRNKNCKDKSKEQIKQREKV